MLGLSMVSGANFVALLFGVIAVIALYVSATDADRRIAEAQARGDEARTEAAKANEHAAGLEKEAGQLRRDNLELEKALRPRLLEQLHSADALKPFAGLQVFIVAVPDFEARRLTGQMAVMFQMAGWTPKIVPPANADDIRDGVEVQYITITLPDISVGDMDAHRAHNDRWQAAAHAIVEQLDKNGIGARSSFIPSRWASRIWDQRFSIDAIAVRVGLKPITYFSSKRLQELIDQSPTGNAVVGNH
jgi:hypothetical protein